MKDLTELDFHGYKEYYFDFDGRPGVVVFPKDDVKTDKWLFKIEHFGAFPEAELDLVARGYHICYLNNIDGYGSDKDQKRKSDFADFLKAEFGLNDRCVPVGMSSGGTHAINFASRYPDRVAALYLDAPVCNLLSCPMAVGDSVYADARQNFIDSTGLTYSKLICYREHPFDRANVLAEHRIPILMIYGDADMTVPYYENGKLVEEYYKTHGCSDIIKVIGKHGCAHHPHGLPGNSEPIIDFITKYY